MLAGELRDAAQGRSAGGLSSAPRGRWEGAHEPFATLCGARVSRDRGRTARRLTGASWFFPGEISGRAFGARRPGRLASPPASFDARRAACGPRVGSDLADLVA